MFKFVECAYFYSVSNSSGSISCLVTQTEGASGLAEIRTRAFKEREWREEREREKPMGTIGRRERGRHRPAIRLKKPKSGLDAA